MCFLLSLLSSVAARRHITSSVPAVETKTISESNRFYSETQKSTTETVKNLIKGEAVVFMLKNSESKTLSALVSNPITVTLS